MADRVPVCRVVLTGGPCSGKTSGIEAIRRTLQSEGYLVYCIPETATLLHTAGATLVVSEPNRVIELQRSILNVMTTLEYRMLRLAAEDCNSLLGPLSAPSASASAPQSSNGAGSTGTVRVDALVPTRLEQDVSTTANKGVAATTSTSAAVSSSRNRVVKGVILLCDRGVLDGSAYCDAETWRTVAAPFFPVKAATSCARSKALGWDLDGAISRYDLILHLVSVAVDAPQFYRRDNNQARSETREQAMWLDASTQRAWTPARDAGKWIAVDNVNRSFEQKLSDIVDIVRQTAVRCTRHSLQSAVEASKSQHQHGASRL